MNIPFAMIGGTGVYDPDIFSDIETMEVETPYGSVNLTAGLYEGRKIAFLPRHGSGHAIPPHKINYRANIWALKTLGVKRVLATAAVGSMNPSMGPGDLVVLTQFMDFTKSRVNTFYDGGEAGVIHTDVSDPYCPQIRQLLFERGNSLGLTIHDSGVYVCTEGPRFETPAEIEAYRRLGGDLVGMTNVPEVTLAREVGLCYGTIAIVTNLAAGISKVPLTHEEVVQIMQENTIRVRSLATEMFGCLPEERDCHCSHVHDPM